MRNVGDRDLNDVVEGLVAIGWTVTEKKKHVVVSNPANPDDRLTLHRGGNGTNGGRKFLKKCRSRLCRAAKGERP